MMKTLFLAVTILIISPVTTIAQVCGINGCNVSSVVVDNHGFNNVVDEFNVVQKNVEFDADYFLGANGYYQVADKLVAQQETRDHDIILRQSEQIDELIKLLEAVLSKQGIDVPEELVPEDTPPVETEGGLIGTELDQTVAAIFTESCVGCHGQNSPKAGLMLMGEEENGERWLRNLSLAERTMVYDYTVGINLKERGKKLMPLGGQPLPDAQIEALRLWMVTKAEESIKQEG